MPRTKKITVTVKSGRKKRMYHLASHRAIAVRRFMDEQIEEDELEGSIPAEKVLPELADDKQRPATLLRGSRYKADLTQEELAKKLGIYQHHISEMEHGERPIGKAVAKKLAKALGCDYRVFL